jgi:SH3 domain-containing YSC84-like protein 1
VCGNQGWERFSAATVFEEIMGTPDKAILQELLEKADCVIVIPGLKKGE